MPTKAEIEASATTPLKPDQSELKIWTWHKVSEELPENNLEVLLLTVAGDRTVGHYWTINEAWVTDLGGFPKTSITHWCMLPEKPE